MSEIQKIGFVAGLIATALNACSGDANNSPEPNNGGNGNGGTSWDKSSSSAWSDPTPSSSSSESTKNNVVASEIPVGMKKICDAYFINRDTGENLGKTVIISESGNRVAKGEKFSIFYTDGKEHKLEATVNAAPLCGREKTYTIYDEHAEAFIEITIPAEINACQDDIYAPCVGEL